MKRYQQETVTTQKDVAVYSCDRCGRVVEKDKWGVLHVYNILLSTATVKKT